MATIPDSHKCGWQTLPITSDGNQRYYMLWTPTWFCHSHWEKHEWDFYFPKIVLVHGFTSNALSLAKLMHIDNRLRMPLIFGVGYEDSWNAIYCCGPARDNDVNDIQYFDDLRNQVLIDFPTFYQSNSPLWMVGHSNGAFMISHYAMHRHVDAAWISEGHVYQFPSEVNPTNVMLVWGSADDVVRPAGCCEVDHCCCDIISETCVDHNAIFLQWSGINKCKMHYTEKREFAHDEFFDSAECRIGVDCEAKTESCMYQGEVHRMQPSLTVFPWFRDVHAGGIYNQSELAKITMQLFPNDWESIPVYNPQRGSKSRSALEESIVFILSLSIGLAIFFCIVLYFLKTCVFEKWNSRYLEVEDYDFGHQNSASEDDSQEMTLNERVKRRRVAKRFRTHTSSV